MCLLVCLSSFYRPHDICPLCGAGSEWPRAAKPSRPGRPRASGQAHAQREHARMPYNFSTKKSYADAFQKQNRTRARMLSYYSLPSLGVFTFRIVLNRTSSLVGADLGQLVYTYKRAVCVCWFVCLLFIGHTTFVHLRRCLRVLREQPSRRGRPRARAGKRMHSESTRAHAVQLHNKKIAALMPFKNKSVRARACCRIRNCRDFQKKG